MNDDDGVPPFEEDPADQAERIVREAMAKTGAYGAGRAALDAVEAMIRKYAVFPSEHCYTAVTLWAAHTHAVGSFYITPRLILDSAEPGSGKTRVEELLALLCLNPKLTISATTAAIFRRLAQGPMTLLFDEVDAIFNAKSAANYEDLRALLNAGYKRGATIDRCVGDAAKMQVQEFSVFAPVALAGLAGNMPSTIITRAIVIHMRRRAPGEFVHPFRERDAEAEAAPVRAALATWMESVAGKLDLARPEMPDGVADRAAEVWEPPLAIADQAGGDWPQRARDACRYFVLDSDPAALSIGIRLLSDLRELFGDRDRMTTNAILDALTGLEDAPWGDLFGKPLDARRLARELKKYGVDRATFKVDGNTAKGYTVFETKGSVGLADAWNRYLPPLTPKVGNRGDIGDRAGQAVTEQMAVTDPSVTGATSVTPVSREVTPVTRVTQGSGSRSDRTRGTCRACGESMTVLTPGQTTHPNCGEADAA